MAIPAAGLGRRFLSQFPKEMLQLGDRMLIDHALAEAARSGFEAAVVVLSPAKAAVREHLTDRAPIPVRFIEQFDPEGPGDAVLRCGEVIRPPFGVLFPDDVVLGVDHWLRLRQLAATTGAATLCVRPVPVSELGRFGVALCDGPDDDLVVRRLVEKPRPGEVDSDLAIFGRYIVTAAVLDALASEPRVGELQLTSGFDAAAQKPPGVRAVLFTDTIYDCGTPEEYERSRRAFPVPAAGG